MGAVAAALVVLAVAVLAFAGARRRLKAQYAASHRGAPASLGRQMRAPLGRRSAPSRHRRTRPPS